MSEGDHNFMEKIKRDSFKIKRESHPVSQQAKDDLKQYNAVKKKILDSMGNEELTIPQIADKIKMSKAETLYYVMSLLKFGLIQVLRIDDMDEFYIYKVMK
jgi:predicted transcriptional regulator